MKVSFKMLKFFLLLYISSSTFLSHCDVYLSEWLLEQEKM